MGVNGIYGLSGSGLDIESLVKVGMMGKQNEYDKMAQKYTQNEWTKSAYLEVSNSITTFNMSKLSDYKMSASMNAKTAVSSDDGIKVTANANAVAMNHTVQVNKTSSNAYLVGIGEVSFNNNHKSANSVSIADVIFKDNMTTSDNGNTFQVTYGAQSTFKADFNKNDVALSFTVKDGVTDKEAKIEYTYGQLYDDGGKTFNDLVSDINNSGINVRASYDSVNNRFSFYNTEGGSANQIKFTINNSSSADGKSGYGAFGVANREPDPYEYPPYSDSERGKGAYVKDSDGKIEVTFNRSGYNNGTYYNANDASAVTKAKQGIAVLNTQQFLDNLNLAQYTNNGTTEGTGTTAIQFTRTGATQTKGTSPQSITIAGTDAEIVIDGVTYGNGDKKITDNKITVNGVTYDMTGATSETKAVVAITQDTDEIVDKVKSFVEDYNKLLASLYEKYDEKPDSNYKPLTQSQKDGMKEEQITKWEEKAKQGLLYHDKTLGNIILEMRDAISESVDLGNGKTASIYSIGISTTGIKGQLVLDETKLRNALSNDPEAVYNTFAKLGDKTKTVNGKEVEDQKYNGIAQRLGDIFTQATKAIKTRAGSTADIAEDSDLNNLLRELQTKMSNFKKMMSAFEDKLYKKYDAMESTLAMLGTQLNFIMGGNS